jgi:glyoxylase-like metal-dependent hydrolase (beta-lactamase superfamily II)
VIETETSGPVLRLRMARTFLGRGVYHTAAYRVGSLMVDSGCAHTLRELLGALEGGPRIEQVVSTHCHEDHIAGNHALAELHGARILAHPLALPVLAAPRELQPQQLYRRLFWGYPEPCVAEAIGDRVETSDGYRFEVIHTPGHSPDHICLFEPREGWLFTGDAFVGGRDRALRRGADIYRIMASLSRLAALDASLLFPGSGTIYRSPAATIRQKLEYLDQLGDRIRELHARGLGAVAIRQTLFGSEHWVSRITGGDFNGENLVRSYLERDPAARLAA